MIFYFLFLALFDFRFLLSAAVPHLFMHVVPFPTRSFNILLTVILKFLCNIFYSRILSDPGSVDHLSFDN